MGAKTSVLPEDVVCAGSAMTGVATEGGHVCSWLARRRQAANSRGRLLASRGTDAALKSRKCLSSSHNSMLSTCRFVNKLLTPNLRLGQKENSWPETEIISTGKGALQCKPPTHISLPSPSAVWWHDGQLMWHDGQLNSQRPPFFPHNSPSWAPPPQLSCKRKVVSSRS